MYNINYIVVFYIGPNRNYHSYQQKFKTDPMFFADKHVEFLNTCQNTNIKKASFVFNDDINDDLKIMATNTVSKIESMETEIIFRKNCGYSYGAWRDVVIKNINDFDYFFLIEDDSLPVNSNFYEYFVEKCNDEYPIIATYVKEHQPGKFHAASSNSLVKADVCRKVIQTSGELFFVNQSNRLEDAWDTQTRFYDHFTNLGYKMTDILDKYSTPHNLNCNINDVRIFGNPNNPPNIIPIIP